MIEKLDVMNSGLRAILSGIFPVVHFTDSVCQRVICFFQSPSSKDVAVCLLMLLFPLVLFWPVSVGNRTLLPVDNLLQSAPFASVAKETSEPRPHNPLISDLILQHYPWRHHISYSFAEGYLPLWNPYLFCGTRFLARGQHLCLYPLSFVFLILPLWKAYGMFMILHLWLAGVFAFILARSLGLSRFASLVTGVTFELSGFMLTRCVFPSVIASAAWLPLVLVAIEQLRQSSVDQNHKRTQRWTAVGVLAFGMIALAGHAEIIYYSLLISLFYGLWRGIEMRLNRRAGLLRFSLCVISMLVLGILLGAVQMLPMYEVLQESFRSEGTTFSQVRGWGYPPRRILALFIPNFFGNPSHHSYFDIFQRTFVQTEQPIDWGIKNFVEGTFHVGILPLLLTSIGIVGAFKKRRKDAKSGIVFLAIALLSLALVFGTPLYAVVYYLPGMQQVRSPFRWSMAFSLAMAVLAGYGMETFLHNCTNKEPGVPTRKLVSRLLSISFWCSAGILVLAVLSFFLFDTVEPLIQDAYLRLALAGKAFTNHRAFWSYEVRWILEFAFLSGAGALLIRYGWRTFKREANARQKFIWQAAVVGILTVDLLRVGWNFYPKNDPELLKRTPEAIEWLKRQPGQWRLTVYDPHRKNILPPNSAWLFDLQDVRGYDSIIPADYARFMQRIEPQGQLTYNRISSLRTEEALRSHLLDLMGVKYVLSEVPIDLPEYRLAHESSGLHVYENLDAFPRAFALPVEPAVIAEGSTRTPDSVDFSLSGNPEEVFIEKYGPYEVVVRAEVEEDSWLVLTDRYNTDWKAEIEAIGDTQDRDVNTQVYRANGIFRTVRLKQGLWKVRFFYRPVGLHIGVFLSGIGMVLLCGGLLWSGKQQRSFGK